MLLQFLVASIFPPRVFVFLFDHEIILSRGHSINFVNHHRRRLTIPIILESNYFGIILISKHFGIILIPKHFEIQSFWNHFEFQSFWNPIILESFWFPIILELLEILILSKSNHFLAFYSRSQGSQFFESCFHRKT